MRKYIFLTFTINQIGGGQLYLDHKALYLKNRGWDVKIVYIQPGELILKDFNLFQTIYLPEISNYVYDFYSNKRKKTIKRLLHFVGEEPCEEGVIESNSDYLATWGEILAMQLRAKHFIYLLAERLFCKSALFSFFKFKYERGELAGITKKSVAELFSNTNYTLSNGSPRLGARGASTSVADIPCDFTFDKDRYVIGVVGRFEKEYVKDTINELISFVLSHPHRKFNVVYVGDETIPTGIKEKIIQSYYGIENVKLTMTGFLFPIPKDLVKAFDCCIASSGAASAIGRCGVPVIVVDPHTLMSDGVLFINTQSRLTSSEHAETVGTWLERIFSHPGNYIIEEKEKVILQDEFHTHFQFLAASSQDKKYDLSFLNYMSFEIFATKFARFILPNKLYTKLSYLTHDLRKK